MLAYSKQFIIQYARYEHRSATLYVQVHSFIHSYISVVLKHVHSPRTAPCWLTSRHVVVTSYRYFGTTHRPFLKLGPIRCAISSTLMAEEHISHPLRGGSLMSRSSTASPKASCLQNELQYILFQCPAFCRVILMSANTRLRLIPRLPVTCVVPSIFPSMMCFRRQFLRKM